MAEIVAWICAIGFVLAVVFNDESDITFIYFLLAAMISLVTAFYGGPL